nr:glycosyltransferase [Kibdelosporangium sp. MJ126-NF4]CEL16212.1 Dolichol-phosphate mannosyltransferase in lipid-linked oligosaccharide synthesis cluster [Kibdelosporangium sp. MJ126-NF4]CTQ94137.1 Dolichol-phosphate mannosyltransferase (EC 2.4.1.83) in lipid-linked oligosaccharide synthesis cluster [Kibdelosporangium sp. MJ126-NF4]
MATDHAVSLTYIVPAHNSTATIEGMLKELADRLAGTNSEVLVVENGSTDGTIDMLHKLEADWQSNGVELRVLTSKKGLGNALRLGIAESRGARVFFGADDLPFGFDDLDKAEKIDHTQHKVVIGSKAHPESETGRGVLRAILTWGFLTLRFIVLGMRTRDPQGTFVLDGDWVRQVGPRLTEEGFLLTTEVTYLAERSGIRTIEVPVRLRESHGEHGSRIRISDVWKMGLGLLTVRRRHRKGVRAIAHAA